MSKPEPASRVRWLIAAAGGLVTALLVLTGGLEPAEAAGLYGYDEELNAYDHVANLAPDAVGDTARSVRRLRPDGGAARPPLSIPGVISAARGPLAPTQASVNAIAERGGVGFDGVKLHILDPANATDTIRYLEPAGCACSYR